MVENHTKWMSDSQSPPHSLPSAHPCNCITWFGISKSTSPMTIPDIASIIYDWAEVAFCLQDDTEVEKAVEQMLAAVATLTSVCQSTPLPPSVIDRLSDVGRQIEMLTGVRWTKHQQFVDSCSHKFICDRNVHQLNFSFLLLSHFTYTRQQSSSFEHLWQMKLVLRVCSHTLKFSSVIRFCTAVLHFILSFFTTSGNL